MTTSQSDWHYIAEQASTEMEADKLLDLVTHLHNVLGEREERARAPATSSDRMVHYRYLSTLSRFVPLAPWEYHVSGGAVCTTESLSGPKLLSSASSARKPVAKCRHPSKRILLRKPIAKRKLH